jgi:5-methylcytosine-specific restriction endonuclease McrA
VRKNSNARGDVTTTFLATLLPATRQALTQLGIQSDEELPGVYVPDLLNAGVSWGQVHRIVKHLVGANLPVRFRTPDATWNESRWQELVGSLVANGILSWEDVAVCVLGELNPPQVGTSLASNDNIKAQYPPRRAMRAVMEWFYAQDGKCQNCGRRIHIEVDHVVSKDEFSRRGRDPAEADTLANLQLLCRRCNVVKRDSHLLGGLSFATAQAALMWILIVERPRARADFENLCRAHGLSMASIRFDEAWAMAIWLAAVGMYELDEPIGRVIEEAVEGAVNDELAERAE